MLLKDFGTIWSMLKFKEFCNRAEWGLLQNQEKSECLGIHLNEGLWNNLKHVKILPVLIRPEWGLLQNQEKSECLGIHLNEGTIWSKLKFQDFCNRPEWGLLENQEKSECQGIHLNLVKRYKHSWITIRNIETNAPKGVWDNLTHVEILRVLQKTWMRSFAKSRKKWMSGNPS